MTTGLQRTPLYEAHLALRARMIDFGGWMMPVQYDGIIAEHGRCRADVALFDTCHMGRFLLTGPDTPQALSELLTTPVLSMADGQCRYGFLLNEDGGILDDLIAYRFGITRWMLVVNAGTRDKDAAWLRARLPASVSFEDVSDVTGKLDIQGPRSLDVVSRLLSVDAHALRYFRFMECRRGDDTLVLSRTGYTGEKGIELYGPVPRIQELWGAFIEGGVRPAGLGARDTLRLEAGLPLYGHELGEAVTPVEAGMQRYAAKVEPFVGRAAVVRRLAEGPARILRGFRIEGRQAARAGNRVVSDGMAVGEVTSGSFSPTLQCVIGFAYIAAAAAGIGSRVDIDTGRTLLEAELVDIPFHKAV